MNNRCELLGGKLSSAGKLTLPNCERMPARIKDAIFFYFSERNFSLKRSRCRTNSKKIRLFTSYKKGKISRRFPLILFLKLQILFLCMKSEGKLCKFIFHDSSWKKFFLFVDWPFYWVLLLSVICKEIKGFFFFFLTYWFILWRADILTSSR